MDGIHFTWFNLIPGVEHGAAFPFLGEGGKHEAYVIPAAWFVCIILVTLAFLARRGIREAARRGGVDSLVPDANLGPRNIMELVVSGIHNLLEGVLGPKDARVFFPFLATLFIYILISNFLALIPGFLPPTASFSNNLSMALVVFLVFNTVGLKRHGFAYVKHLWGPIFLLGPFFLVIELVGLLVRPISLSLRLAGNLFGDHMVFGIMNDLTKVVIPVPFLGLGLFVSFIQALVFTLLSTVYIALAAGGDDH